MDSFMDWTHHMNSSMAESTEKSKKSDRRVAYTKMALRQALVQLMGNQHVSGITVKSICALADINRSTFYLHYRDQYDLLHQIEQEVLEALNQRLLQRQASAPTTTADEKSPLTTKDNSGLISLETMTEILEYARENAALARVLLSENCDFAFQQDIMSLAQLVMFFPGVDMDARIREYIMLYGISGSIALAEKWLKDGTIEEPEVIAQLMLQMLYFGTVSITTMQG